MSHEIESTSVPRPSHIRSALEQCLDRSATHTKRDYRQSCILLYKPEYIRLYVPVYIRHVYSLVSYCADPFMSSATQRYRLDYLTCPPLHRDKHYGCRFYRNRHDFTSRYRRDIIFRILPDRDNHRYPARRILILNHVCTHDFRSGCTKLYQPGSSS